jgi:hypothetical protein
VRQAKAHPIIVNVKVELRRARLIAIAEALTMLRQNLVRSLKRPAQRAALNGSRPFSASATRRADVEITVGVCHWPLPREELANELLQMARRSR